MSQIFTIGHSNRTLAEFLELLGGAGVNLLVDVRSVPKSRHNPHFNADALEAALRDAAIGYRRMPELGGLRSHRKDQGASANLFWDNEIFRNYADYAATSPFKAALNRLREIASFGICAIMCAEADWRNCHRRIIADYLIAAGEAVTHITGAGRQETAQLTDAAVMGEEGVLNYPAAQGRLLL